MGNIFAKKEKSRITEQDKAILALKKQRDQLKQYQKRISGVLEKDREIAKRLLKEGKKDRAKLLLRKKKYMVTFNFIYLSVNLLSVYQCLFEQDLEFTQVEHKVLEGLKKGNEALQRANSVFSTEDIEDLLDETKEAIDKQREIDELLSGQLTQEDEDDVMAELDQLLEAELGELEPVLPTPPTTLPEAKEENNMEDIEVNLPDVPTHNPEMVAPSKKKTAVAAS
ncbi:charged multivesicular body protein 6-A [Eurytemora carolleeae]|uniref:charged multivesicular body protein 6-A n=1 Tax=Eurytemora carolleeae TaxID=1294199 RepID=UPI000C78A509|nr:charged multivesicular body protein 6-A [Eurytemora carolleeae]|eukprot:XP_023336398.1 charged multivesicular body protein 6-A-like [Eurytemora affinis]